MDRNHLPIGILGGTFDPIHFGHLRLAVELKEKLQLTQMLLVPSRQPPHRNTPQALAAQRLEMLMLAIANESSLEIEPCELNREGFSYTFDTLNYLRAQHGRQQSLCLIMGADAFLNFDSWYRWQDLLSLAHIVVVHRPGWKLDAMNPTVQKLYQQHQLKNLYQLHMQPAGGIWLETMTPLDISSSQIRTLISQQRNPRFLLPENVLNYIQQQGLYTHGINEKNPQ